MKKLISLLLAITIITSASFSAYATGIGYNNNFKKNNIEVVDISKGHQVVYYDNVIVDDVTTQEYRKIVTKCGNDVSEYYEDFSTGMASLSVNGSIVDTYNMNTLRNDYIHWEMPEQDAVLIEKYLSESKNLKSMELPAELESKYELTYDKFGVSVIKPILNASDTRASNIVYPDGPVTETYPEYMYKKVSSRSTYSTSCGRYLSMSIKDSMYSYSQTSKKSYYYGAGTAVSVIAGALKISAGTLLSTLTGLTTISSGVLKLSSSIDYYFSETYSFYALRQACIYDYSYNNSDVSVLTKYGTGQISMTWDYKNNEYVNPSWKITGLAYPHTISYNEMYNQAKDIWEFNMEQYGYWKWGNL